MRKWIDEGGERDLEAEGYRDWTKVRIGDWAMVKDKRREVRDIRL